MFQPCAKVIVHWLWIDDARFVDVDAPAGLAQPGAIQSAPCAAGRNGLSRSTVRQTAPISSPLTPILRLPYSAGAIVIFDFSSRF